ncbi:MAG: hypothetical protein HUK21_04010, partial [Fibrobacteraceae bacterium]|nr:hypothetical protein [Fibrobacteraceae bacterium]
VLLVAFLVITFWGILSQGVSGDAASGERFFSCWFVWALEYVPIPAFKTLSLLSIIHLIFSLVYRIPKNFGLWGIHLSLIVLLGGSLLLDCFYEEYEGYGLVSATGGSVVEFVSTQDDFEVILDDSLTFFINGYKSVKKGDSFSLGNYDFFVLEFCKNGIPTRNADENSRELKNATGYTGFSCGKSGGDEENFPGIVLRTKHKRWGSEDFVLLGLDEPQPWILEGGSKLYFSHRSANLPFTVHVYSMDERGADIVIEGMSTIDSLRLGSSAPLRYKNYTLHYKGFMPMSSTASLVLFDLNKCTLFFVPYVFMALFLLSALGFYINKFFAKKKVHHEKYS